MKAILLALLLGVSLSTSSLLQAAEKSPDLSGTSDQGLKIEIYSNLSPLTINTIHSWHIRILGLSGQTASIEQLRVIGGMPEHDHGLPTQPQITSRLKNGDYLLEGVRFHMPGKWELIISLKNGDKDDQSIIEFQL